MVLWKYDDIRYCDTCSWGWGEGRCEVGLVYAWNGETAVELGNASLGLEVVSTPTTSLCTNTPNLDQSTMLAVSWGKLLYYRTFLRCIRSRFVVQTRVIFLACREEWKKRETVWGGTNQWAMWQINGLVLLNVTITLTVDTLLYLYYARPRPNDLSIYWRSIPLDHPVKLLVFSPQVSWTVAGGPWCQKVSSTSTRKRPVKVHEWQVLRRSSSAHLAENEHLLPKLENHIAARLSLTWGRWGNTHFNLVRLHVYAPSCNWTPMADLLDKFESEYRWRVAQHSNTLESVYLQVCQYLWGMFPNARGISVRNV